MFYGDLACSNVALSVGWDAAGIYTDRMRCRHMRRYDANWSVHWAASSMGCFEHWPSDEQSATMTQSIFDSSFQIFPLPAD